MGSTKRHVDPPSLLIASPQFVPTYTLFALAGSKAMPNADGSSRRSAVRQKFSGGVADDGCVHVEPPLVLTLMPARLCTRPS